MLTLDAAGSRRHAMMCLNLPNKSLVSIMVLQVLGHKYLEFPLPVLKATRVIWQQKKTPTTMAVPISGQ